MDYRLLGRTGVYVSPLCLGCMMFGARTEPDDAYAIIDRAIDRGVNFLDTANAYSRGRSEEITGEALKRNGKRDRVVLATKVHGRMDDEDPNAGGTSRRHIMQQCDASLKRLQTDWIDLYQLHRPHSEIAIDETLGALDDLVRAGKIRYIGTSTFAAWQVMESIMVSRERGFNRVVCEQPPLNLLDRRVERELIPFARTYGLGVIPWSPLGGGLLSGKYRDRNDLPKDSRFGRAKLSPMQQRRLTDAIWNPLDAYHRFCEARGWKPSQAALAWCRDRPGVTSPIIGPRTMEQLEDNLGSLELALSEEDLEELDAIFAPGEMISPFYDADFGPGLFR